MAGSRRNDEGGRDLLYLAQRGPHADEVFTRYDGRIVAEIERLLRGRKAPSPSR